MLKGMRKCAKRIVILLLALIILMQGISHAEEGMSENQGWYVLGNIAGKQDLYKNAYTTDVNLLNESFDEKEALGTTYNGTTGTYRWISGATLISYVFEKIFNVSIGDSTTRHYISTYASSDGSINAKFNKRPSMGTDYWTSVGDIVIWNNYKNIGICTKTDGSYCEIMYAADKSYHGLSDTGVGGIYREEFEEEFLQKQIRLVYQGKLTTNNGLTNTTAEDVVKELTQALGFTYTKAAFKEWPESGIDKTKEFAYQGIAKLDKVTVDVTKTPTIFSKLSDILSWFFNFIFTMLKGVVVGMTTVAHVVISGWVNAASGGEAFEMKDGLMAYFTNMRANVENAISLEKIVYNLVPVLNVNIFSAATTSLTSTIRDVTSNIYYSLRYLALIGLLLTFIFMGIKMAISTVAEAKAEYKKNLKSWLIAFCIVFGMHYFMILVININEIIVNFIRGIGVGIASGITGSNYNDLAIAMRDLTYSNNMSTSAVATAMYAIMIYYLIKFVIIYFKRLFVAVVLIILAPFMGIKYAYDKIRFNKSNSLSTWGKEFVFTVGSQTIHALIYTIFVGTTFSLLTNEAVASKMIVCVLGCLFFRFMTTADKLLRGMLRLVGDQASNIMGEIENTNIGDLFGLAVWTRLKAWNNTKVNKALMPNSVTKEYSNAKKGFRNYIKNAYVSLKVADLKENKMYGKAENETTEYMRKKHSELDRKLKDLASQDFELQMQNMWDGFKTGGSLLVNFARIPVGLAVAGASSLLIGANRVYVGAKTIGCMTINGIKGVVFYNRNKRYRAQNGTYKQMSKWVTLNGLGMTRNQINKLNGKYISTKSEDLANLQLKEEMFALARREEEGIAQEIADKKENVLKGAVDEKATPLEKKLAEVYTKDLKNNVEDAMKTVDRKDIKAHVKEYMKKHNKRSLKTDDIHEISKKFEVRVSGELVEEDTIDHEMLMENVKNATKDKVLKQIIDDERIVEEVNIEEETIEKMEKAVDEKIKIASEEEKKGFELVKQCLKDKKEAITKNTSLSVFEKMNEVEKNFVMQEIEELISDDIIEKQVNKMQPDEIVETIKTAVDMEESISKEYVRKEFRSIVEHVERIRQLDEFARETGQEKMYKDVSKLVEDMIKNKNISNEK